MNKEKFKAYWESIGRPIVEFETRESGNWITTSKPDWSATKYRIKDDPHWKLRQKWIESDFTLTIEMLNAKGEWVKAQQFPFWFDHIQYREAVVSNQVQHSNESHKILKHFMGCDEIENYLLAKAILFYFEHHPEDKGLLDI